MPSSAHSAPIHEGRWRRLPNLAAETPGIHSDDVAQELGFRAGPVLGDTAAEAVVPAIVATLGERWFEGGWMRVKLVSPVYADEEVRESAVGADDGSIELALTTHAGRLACVGGAGLGAVDPWDAREDGRRGADVALPGLRLGAPVAEVQRTVTAAEVAELCDAAGDQTSWFRGSSPWGGAIAPPISLLLHAHDIQVKIPPGPGVLPQAMGADYQVVIERPVPLDAPLRIRTRWVDKGVSGRCWFRTIEFETRDALDRPCARGRQRVKWFIEPPAEGAPGAAEGREA
jgi:hypothetical protein